MEETPEQVTPEQPAALASDDQVIKLTLDPERLTAGHVEDLFVMGDDYQQIAGWIMEHAGLRADEVLQLDPREVLNLGTAVFVGLIVWGAEQPLGFALKRFTFGDLIALRTAEYDPTAIIDWFVKHSELDRAAIRALPGYIVAKARDRVAAQLRQRPAA